ncbi:uncharacterized protein LOC120538306 [Polypterus senegalus]|uniref:uncharacterized protein LOC120538306 n=1 Tax=Polypterus senegalus TaxID=55291 RepID=UPI001962F796|nr:uncharacterized protein LOC120538306 [Polypterus senegalus]
MKGTAQELFDGRSTRMELHGLLIIFVLLLPQENCQGFKVSQPQSPMEGVESSNVTLICDVSSETPLGPLRWYRAAGSERTHFYSGAPKGGDKNDRRVTWAVENPTVNYSITIRDLRVSDTGEYYCVKYTKADENKPNAPPHATGPGVSLTVKEFVNQSQGSVDAVVGSNVTLLCLLSSPLLKGPVKWMKKTSNGKKHIYSSLSSGTEKNDSRVTWTEAKPTVNFSITIRSVQLNDTGTYYCEKYKDGDMNTPFKAKEGVQLNVKGSPIISVLMLSIAVGVPAAVLLTGIIFCVVCKGKQIHVMHRCNNFYITEMNAEQLREKETKTKSKKNQPDSSFRLLGVHINNCFLWFVTTTCILKKAQQQLFFLNSVKRFGEETKTLAKFSRCTIGEIPFMLMVERIKTEKDAGKIPETENLEDCSEVKKYQVNFRSDQQSPVTTEPPEEFYLNTTVPSKTKKLKEKVKDHIPQKNSKEGHGEEDSEDAKCKNRNPIYAGAKKNCPVTTEPSVELYLNTPVPNKRKKLKKKVKDRIPENSGMEGQGEEDSEDTKYTNRNPIYAGAGKNCPVTTEPSVELYLNTPVPNKRKKLKNKVKDRIPENSGMEGQGDEDSEDTKYTNRNPIYAGAGKNAPVTGELAVDLFADSPMCEQTKKKKKKKVQIQKPEKNHTEPQETTVEEDGADYISFDELEPTDPPPELPSLIQEIQNVQLRRKTIKQSRRIQQSMLFY